MKQVRAPLSIDEVPLPRIRPDEVLIETRTSGICGTDLHILEGHGYVPALPHILGHEPAGVVAEVGAEVDNLKPGDRVVPHLFITCGRCRYCREGRKQQCGSLKGIIGVLCAQGAFAEFFKAPARNLYKLPDHVPFDEGGLIADAVLTAVHASRRATVGLNQTAVVIGAGGVGQVLIQLLSAAGARVAAVDVDAAKREKALALGATIAVDPADDSAVKRIHDLSDGGAECAINCAGTSASMRFAADAVMRCGRIVVVGEEPQDPRIDTIEIAQKELEIIGSRNGTEQDMEDAVRLVASGTVHPVIAARYPLAEINAAFDHMRRGAMGRVVVVIKD